MNCPTCKIRELKFSECRGRDAVTNRRILVVDLYCPSIECWVATRRIGERELLSGRDIISVLDSASSELRQEWAEAYGDMSCPDQDDIPGGW